MKTDERAQFLLLGGVPAPGERFRCSPESACDTAMYGSSELAAEKVLVLPTRRAAKA